MTATARLARLERSLAPRDAVLLWFETARKYRSLTDYARSILGQGDPAPHMTWIQDQVVSSVTEALAGKGPLEIEREIWLSLRDAMFLYHLVVVLNVTAGEYALLAQLRSRVLVAELGPLVMDPLSEDVVARRANPENARRVDRSWQLWRESTEAWVSDVRLEQLARSALDDAYFGGRPVLFDAVAEDWMQLGQQADRLQSSVETLREPFRTRAGFHRQCLLPKPASSIASRAGARAAELADDARIAAFGALGERHRALRIVERRLRA